MSAFDSNQSRSLKNAYSKVGLSNFSAQSKGGFRLDLTPEQGQALQQRMDAVAQEVSGEKDVLEKFVKDSIDGTLGFTVSRE